MQYSLWMTAVLAVGCQGESTNKDGTSDTAVDVDSGESCEEGFAVGQCPRDFSLPNQDGAVVTLSEKVGQSVVVIGAAEW